MSVWHLGELLLVTPGILAADNPNDKQKQRNKRNPSLEMLLVDLVNIIRFTSMMVLKKCVVPTTSSRTDKGHVYPQKMRCRYGSEYLMAGKIVQKVSSSWKLLMLMMLLMPAMPLMRTDTSRTMMTSSHVDFGNNPFDDNEDLPMS
jgi:hypothetical protein